MGSMWEINIYLPGDSSRDLFSPKPRAGHDSQQPLSSGHVFTHHPKKVTNSQNCQEGIFRWYCSWFRNLKQPPGMYKTLVNNGILNYPYQLVQDFCHQQYVLSATKQKTYHTKPKPHAIIVKISCCKNGQIRKLSISKHPEFPNLNPKKIPIHSTIRLHKNPHPKAHLTGRGIFASW